MRRISWIAAAASVLAGGAIAQADTPSAEQALRLRPVQKDVEYDVLDASEIAKATVASEKTSLGAAWIVRDARGQILRQFVDTNGDNVVDMWCYFSHGVETYRDIDSNFNGRADQCRWLNRGGARWGIDADEDSKIDSWKMISAEEVTQELVRAIAQRDSARFERLLISDGELKSLGLGPQHLKEVAGRLAEAKANFATLLRSPHGMNDKSEWMHFAAIRPSVIPAGTNDSTKDLIVYENVAALVETEGKSNQILIGALVHVGPAWRLIDVPSLNDGAGPSPLFNASVTRGPDAADHPGVPADFEKMQKLLTELEAVDRAMAAATSPAAQHKQIDKRIEILEQLAAAASEPRDKVQWIHQVADTLSAAAQSNGYTAAVDKLQALAERVAKEPNSEDLTAYVKFRHLTADYGSSLQAPKPDFVSIQKRWLDGLQDFVKSYPRSPDAAEALLQLAMAEEFAGQDDAALDWYKRIVAEFPNTAAAKRSAGAVRRLSSVGKTIDLAGVTTAGNKLEISQLRGRVVLIHYWATNYSPSTADLATIKDLYSRYGKSGFVPVGVNLDSDRNELARYLNRERITWPTLHESGGIDGALANELGVLTMPTMLLLDKQGRVVNRSITAGELEEEIKKHLQAK